MNIPVKTLILIPLLVVIGLSVGGGAMYFIAKPIYIVADQISSLGVKLESIDGKLNSMGSKLESIDGKLNSMGSKLENINGKLKVMSSKIDRSFLLR